MKRGKPSPRKHNSKSYLGMVKEAGKSKSSVVITEIGDKYHHPQGGRLPAGVKSQET